MKTCISLVSSTMLRNSRASEKKKMPESFILEGSGFLQEATRVWGEWVEASPTDACKTRDHVARIPFLLRARQHRRMLWCVCVFSHINRDPKNLQGILFCTSAFTRSTWLAFLFSGIRILYFICSILSFCTLKSLI